MDKMILYSENPNLGIKTVDTFSGEKEYRKNCKKIKNQYYVINKDCFLIGDTWFRTDSGLIAKDYEKNEWFVLKNPQVEMQYGIVSGNPLTKGYFTKNPYKNVQTPNEMALSAEVATEAGLVEDVSTGVYKKDAKAKILNLLDHTSKGYNIEDNTVEYPMKRKLYEKYNLKIGENVEKYSQMLGDLTFGGEFECMKGYLPNHLQSRYGIVVCRDGSLKDESGKPGPEFVTIPLQGSKGVQTLIDFCKETSKRTQIGINCSFHLHNGNIDTSKEFVVALFVLCRKIQNEIFQMFPYYKANPAGIKHKNYNQKLPTLQIYTFTGDKRSYNSHIEDSYRRIFIWLGDGLEPERNSSRKVYNHPMASKWDRKQRYFWMNLMNVMFSNRNTIEWRLHTPTTNAQKVFNWLFICNALIRYAQEHAEEILSSRRHIKLGRIIDYYGEKYGDDGRQLSEYLRSYVRARKEEFFKDYEDKDFVSQWDIDNDKEYRFKFQGMEDMFES